MRGLVLELRAELAAQQMTRKRLVTASGVPMSTVQKTLAGKRRFDVDELAALCIGLDVLPSEILLRAEQRMGL